MSAERLLSAALALLLAAGGAAAAVSLAREARRGGFGSFTESLDRRAARALHDVELYRALRDLGGGGPVFFVGDADDPASHLAFSQTEPLAFPRRFHRVENVPEGWTPDLAGLDPRTLVVAYGSRRGLDLSAWLEPAAEGRRFRVWRLRAPEAPR